MFETDFISALAKEIEKASVERDTGYFCTTRDIFQARLDSFVARTSEYLASAVIGEIGNNTFDHNWDYAEGQSRGAYFNADYHGFIVLADFGRGLRKSLATVKECESDLDAITTAFTEHLSGRAPEQRGNGLKFVSETVKEKGWSLYFQSGAACCIIGNGKVAFKSTDSTICGCFAILRMRGNQ